MGDDPCFVEWKEQFVSQERGNRVVHYILKDSSGESILAIVGTERSVRHMFYVVADEFVQAYGADFGIDTGFKWRSRRVVVDWLTSMISKHSESPKTDAIQALGSFEFPVTESQAQGCPASTRNGGKSDIVWSGCAWSCVKQLKHYPSFRRNGIIIAVNSFVFVMGKGETHYLAHLEDMYEDKRGQKKVKVRWLHRSEEVKGVTPLRNTHQKEVFMTPYTQVISPECVDGPATVLTREHYDQCIASFPHASSSKMHICFRQFKGHKVKPFDLSKICGYFDQPVLACLLSSLVLKSEPAKNGMVGGEDEDLRLGDDVKVGGKRARSGRGYLRSAMHSGKKRSSEDLKPLTYRKRMKYGVSGKRLLPPKHVESQPCYAPSFRVDDKIELLCQDSGIRGCWFRCTVLEVTRKQIKVQYNDLHEEDGLGNLEEWIPAVKFAMPDKLSMRLSGRLTTRPVPPATTDQISLAFDPGVAVDAWWSDGWWEGVVMDGKDDNVDHLQIYFPGENLLMSVTRKDLRKSRDWVEGRWVDIEAKPEICSFITAAITLESKLSTSPIPNNIKSDAAAAAIKDVDLAAGTEPSSAEEVTPNSALLAAASNCLPEVKEDGNKVPPLKEEGNEVLVHKRSDNDDDKVEDNQVRVNGENHEKPDNVWSNEESIIVSTEPLGENSKNVQVRAEIAA